MTATLTAATEPPAAVTPPTTTSPAGRNGRGRFAPGNPGGPGRPPKIRHIEREVLACMATVLSPEIWMRVTEAMALQAMEGNVAAANWLSKTFMTGGLSQAAAAQAVGITREAEMLVLGKSQHPEWVRLWDERLAAERDREASLPTPAIAAQPVLLASPEVAAGVVPSECTVVERGPSQLGAAEGYALETVETVKTVKTVESTPAAVARGAAPSVAPTGSPAAPRPPLAAPPSERVRGFRVTKGPRPSENGHKRSHPARPAAVSSPRTPCAGH